MSIWETFFDPVPNVLLYLLSALKSGPRSVRSTCMVHVELSSCEVDVGLVILSHGRTSHV